MILQGHVLDVLKTLPDDSVDCVVTSPPYWGLRDYKIEPQVWDAVEDCEHEWGDKISERSDDTGWQRNRKGLNKAAEISDGNPRTATTENPIVKREFQFCHRCGAWRGSLGLEPTPELYCQHIVQVFREVRRVLKPTGTVFCNLGDSYVSNASNQVPQTKDHKGSGYRGPNRNGMTGLKPKDLCGIPWRVAFALQADGWWLRSEIIWAKLNPMPESCKDRPTKAHETIFLLTKSAKYFWNAEAVREKAKYGRSEWNYPEDPIHGGSALYNATGAIGIHDVTRIKGSCKPGKGGDRNIRSVWTFATEPTPEAHFATFPQELVRRCILAGTSEKGCCPKCGKPWVPVVERISKGKSYAVGKSDAKRGQGLATAFSGYDDGSSCPEFKTTGWRPSCACGEEKTVPAVVCDPFFGSGTTGIVAENLYRKWIGIELNPEYIEIAKKRLRAKANVDQVNWMKGE